MTFTWKSSWVEISFNEDLQRIEVSSRKAFQGLKEEYKEEEEEDIIMLQTS